MEKRESRNARSYTCLRCRTVHHKKRHRCDRLYPGKSGFFCEKCFLHLKATAVSMSPSKKASDKEGKSTGQRKFHPVSAQEDRQSGDEQFLCAFCGLGESATDVCGQLHRVTVNHEPLAAHHKCMQYSSALVQYTFPHFGGFKIEEVMTEINRGRRLACFACKKNKAIVKGKITGATAGCGWKTCNKSFHFYCAAKYAMVSRRSCVNRTGKKIDLYRVFCCSDHKEKYIKHSSGIGEQSCEETDEEGEERTGARDYDSESEDTSEDEVRNENAKDRGQNKGEEEPTSGEDSDEEGERRAIRSEKQQRKQSDDDDKAQVETDVSDGALQDSDDSEAPKSTDNSQKNDRDYDPYAAIPSTSDSSDPEMESHQQKKKFSKSSPSKVSESAGRKNLNDKERMVKAQNPLKPGSPTVQVTMLKKSVAEDDEDQQQDSSDSERQLEIADRIKMSPRKAKRKSELLEDDSDSVVSPAKRKKNNSPTSKSPKTSNSSHGIKTFFTSDEILEDGESSSEDADDVDPPEGWRNVLKGSGSSKQPKQADDTKHKKRKKETLQDTPVVKKSSASNTKTSGSSEKLKKTVRNISPGSSQAVQHNGKHAVAHGASTPPHTSVGSAGTSKQVSLEIDIERDRSRKSKPEKQSAVLQKERRKSSSVGQASASSVGQESDVSGNTRVQVHPVNNISLMPECVLVIPLDVERFQTVASTICTQLAQEMSVHAHHVHDWTSFAPATPSIISMTLYFTDIALHLRKGDWASLGKLLVDQSMIKKKFQKEYKQKMELYEEPSLQKGLISTTKKMLKVITEKAEKENTPVGKISSAAGVDYLALIISDASDPDKHIRGKLHGLFEWKQNIDFDPGRQDAGSLLAQEVTILEAWLSTKLDHRFQLHQLPKDLNFCREFESEEADSFSRVKAKLDKLRTTHGRHDATEDEPVVLLFDRVDRRLVSFELYLERVLLQHVDEHTAKHVICLVPAHNFKNKGYPVRPDHFGGRVKVSSVFDPTKESVLFIVIEVWHQDG